MTNRVVPNVSADVAIRDLSMKAVEMWAEVLLAQMVSNAHQITGMLKASLTYEGPERDGDVIKVQHHDGPGDGGKTYGAAEEVMRGHLFMRSALSTEASLFPDIVKMAFEDPAAKVDVHAPQFGTAAGGWQPIPGGKVYNLHDGSGTGRHLAKLNRAAQQDMNRRFGRRRRP